ncbi:MAG: hypothetical protein CSA50_07365 [Gammaproteobacteria bacterium]|nr:MAG: hypothetical protein CSA50_07365 [Gammaproteobacteria bacterium]
MKKIALIVALLPTIVSAARMVELGIDVRLELAKAQMNALATPAEPKFSQELQHDRQKVYLDTLNRLIQIEQINRLPATASGATGNPLNSCNYARNVLLEYRLELDSAKAKGKTDKKLKSVKKRIANWKKNVRQRCR